MATLHVRNVPDRLYRRIQKLAEEDNRSLTAEVIEILARGVKAREERRGTAEIIEHIRRQSRTRELPGDWTDSTELIREDRRR